MPVTESGLLCCTQPDPMTTYGSSQPDRIFHFGSFELSEREGELRKNGVRIKLQEHPFRVLLELVSNRGRLVTREELQQKLWPADTFVDFDVGLNTAIRKLRQALGDEADNPRFIETLSRRGYRFVAPVADTASMLLPTGHDSPSEAPSSLSSDGVAIPSTDAGSYADRAAAGKKLRWHWVLAASCGIGLFIYGAVVASLRMTTPPLATEQRITANPSEAPVVAAVVSPDGKYIAYADTTGVYIRHIDTGETRPLQFPNGFDAVPTSWFPDGTHLLLSSGEALYALGQPRTEVSPSLWKVSLLGGGPQKVIDNASGGTVSPDGSKIAFLRGDAVGSPEIWVMGSDGSNPQRVVEAAVPAASIKTGNTVNVRLTSVIFSGVAWSPDGTRLAYLRRFEAASPGPSEDKHSLETVDLLGSNLRVLKISTHLLEVVCWAADGRLFYGYRDDPASERVDSRNLVGPRQPKIRRARGQGGATDRGGGKTRWTQRYQRWETAGFVARQLVSHGFLGGYRVGNPQSAKAASPDPR